MCRTRVDNDNIETSAHKMEMKTRNVCPHKYAIFTYFDRSFSFPYKRIFHFSFPFFFCDRKKQISRRTSVGMAVGCMKPNTVFPDSSAIQHSPAVYSTALLINKHFFFLRLMAAPTMALTATTISSECQKKKGGWKKSNAAGLPTSIRLPLIKIWMVRTACNHNNVFIGLIAPSSLTELSQSSPLSSVCAGWRGQQFLLMEFYQRTFSCLLDILRELCVYILFFLSCCCALRR